MNMEMTNPNDQRSQSSRWIIGGCIALFVCAVTIGLAILGGLYWMGLQTAEEVTVSLDVPVEMQSGTPAEFSLDITNVHAEAVELNSIDISLNYLSGMFIESSDPPFVETSQFDNLGETFQTFTYDLSIAPGETVTLTFSGRALLAGDFSGIIDICINSAFNCKTNILRTIIK